VGIEEDVGCVLCYGRGKCGLEPKARDNMGSYVLIVVMKGKDVYVMNVRDSHTVMTRRPEPDLKNVLGKAS
jgi:hypothetical protein